MRVHAFGSMGHYRATLQPILDALPAELRGERWAPYNRDGWLRVPHRGRRPEGPVLVAGWQDAQAMRPAPVVYVEHGSGQHYPGDPLSASHGSYSGGGGLDHAILFLGPGEAVAARWRAVYDAPAVAVGCPRLDKFHGNPARDGLEASIQPVVAFAWHWACRLIPETDTALPHYRAALPDIIDALRYAGLTVVGHGHPRAPRLREMWARLDVPWWEWEDVIDRADVLVADNTSLLPEAASVGTPLVWLDSPAYRRDVDHGGRFWDWPRGQVQIGDPSDVVAGVLFALDDPPTVRGFREAMVTSIYAHTGGDASQRAADAIEEALTSGPVPRHT